MTTIEIGNRIKDARYLRGVTLDDIALRVGVAKSTIQRYETGKISKIKIPVLESIAKALDVNPAWLIGKTNEMNVLLADTFEILTYYNKLNDSGKKEATKRVMELTYIPQYSPDYHVKDIT